MDVCADRAIIVRLVRRMLSWILLGRRRLERRQANDGRAGGEFFEMDVSERKDKLQRHRCEREPSAPPPISSNPTHHGSYRRVLSAAHVITATVVGQCARRDNDCRPSVPRRNRSLV